MNTQWMKSKCTWAISALAVAIAAGTLAWATYAHRAANEYCLAKWRSPAVLVAGRYYCRLQVRGYVIYRRIGK